MTEWGPYDWSEPLLWPADSARGTPLRLARARAAGSMARRRSARHRACLARQRRRRRRSASTPSSSRRRKDPKAIGTLTLEHLASANGAARTKRFSYRLVRSSHRVVVGFLRGATARLTRDAMRTRSPRRLRGTPVLTRQASRFDYTWYRPTIQGVPAERFAILATGTVMLDSGTYTLRTISDDGVRVWVDGRLAIDSWAPHESRVDFAALGAGRHAIRVEYYQLQGWTELRVDIVRGAQRSEGSPGPH